MDQLRALRVFDRVVTDGSFAAAARSLDLTPPVVTRLLAELELHVGVRLLNRTTRRMALTPAGEAYLETARRVMADWTMPTRWPALPAGSRAACCASCVRRLSQCTSWPCICRGSGRCIRRSRWR